MSHPPLRNALAGATVLCSALAIGCGNGATATCAATVGAFPGPRATAASPCTQITLRGVRPDSVGDVEVTGSSSGRHPGRLLPQADGRGASFVPDRPFAAGERVTVHTGLHISGARHGTYRFSVARPATVSAPPFGEIHGDPSDVLHFASRPDLLPPRLTIVARRARRESDYLFYAPKIGPGLDGPMIVDDRGQPVWMHPLPSGVSATDFKVQRYRGRPVLTWWQGQIRHNGIGQGTGVVVGSDYRPIARVHAGNGYRSDLHEFELTDRGTALVTAYQPVRRDLSSVGGSHDGAVLDAIVQEVSLKTGLVRFEWHSVDHVPLRASYQPLPKDGSPWDYFHVNSIEVEPDGNLLVGARNTWALYEVSRRTGAVLSVVGGKLSSFRMAPGTRFSWQHDARIQPDGTITVFDDAAAPRERPQSRGIRLRVDRRAGVVRLVGPQFTHRGHPLSAANQGSMQVLPDADVVLGWGNHAWISEYGPDGRVLLDARMPANDQSYRSFRFPWTGRPRTRPAVSARTAGATTTVAASWNGATGVASWRVLAGQAGGSLHPVATRPREGFETTVGIPSSARVAVQALDGAGRVLATSRTVTAAGPSA